MGTPFSDITLYFPTSHSNDTPQYWEETALQNFISDFYVQKMNGYKPPNATRVTLQPAYYGIWNRTWKNGSIFAIAPEFIREKYDAMDTHGRYQYILDIIHESMLALSDEYSWNKAVFEKAYREIVAEDFVFRIDYPRKMSRDRKKTAHLSLEKTETVTSLYTLIETGNANLKVKLFDKRNRWWYDSVYFLAKYAKWLNNERFGISFPKGEIEVYYSLSEKEVFTYQSGQQVPKIDFAKTFHFEL